MSVATLGYGRTNALYGRQRNTSVVSTNGSCSIVKGWKSKGSDSSRPRALQVRNGHDQFFIVKSLASSMQLSEFGFVDSVALRFDSWLNKQSQGGADCKRNTRSNNKGLRILNSAKCGRRAAYELNEVDKNINSSVEPFIVEVEPVAVFNSKELFVARDLFHFESLVAVVVEKAGSLVEPESYALDSCSRSSLSGYLSCGDSNATTGGLTVTPSIIKRNIVQYFPRFDADDFLHSGLQKHSQSLSAIAVCQNGNIASCQGGGENLNGPLRYITLGICVGDFVSSAGSDFSLFGRLLNALSPFFVLLSRVEASKKCYEEKKNQNFTCISHEATKVVICNQFEYITEANRGISECATSILLHSQADSCYAFPKPSQSCVGHSLQKTEGGCGSLLHGGDKPHPARFAAFSFVAPVMAARMGGRKPCRFGLRRARSSTPVRAAAQCGSWSAVVLKAQLEAIMANTTLGNCAQTTPFNFQNHAIRLVIRNDEPWFVATDVCEALGYINPSKAVADHLDSDERSHEQLDRTRMGSKAIIINESGLYALVLRSRKPEARKFAKWVTGEVLPTIRKSGGYSNAPVQKVSEHEVLFTFICELIDSGRFGFDQISGIAHKSNGRLLEMIDQAVISDKVRAIRSQIHGLNLAELHQVAELSGSLAMCEAAVIRKNGKTSEQLMEARR